MKKYFKIDPLKSFIELPILWVVVICLLLISIFTTIVIIHNSEITFSMDFNGLNKLVEIFKIPLAILAVIITYSAFLATIHRSVQTKEQIIITNKQNTFSNYYKHIEEFEKYMNTMFARSNIYCKNLRLTHKYLFPQAIDGNYSVNMQFVQVIETEYHHMIHQLEKFNQTEDKSAHDIFYKIYSSLDLIFSVLEINISYSNTYQSVQNGTKIHVPNFDLKGAFSVIKSKSEVLEKILLFDHTFIFPNSYQRVSRISTDVVPDWSFNGSARLEKFNVFSTDTD